MAASSAFTPKASLCDAPTNLKEAIDWVLRVTGRDGKELGNGECICGLAAAVTDLLQSVELEYHGYQGDVKSSGDANKGATNEEVTKHLNGLFSLVQGLGGTAVVRTYIDQLAQILSALVGWSKIEQCSGDKQADHGTDKCQNGGKGGSNGCKYLQEVQQNNCKHCQCKMGAGLGNHLGRGCTKCKDSGGSPHKCKCEEAKCTGTDKCQCALDGKCCKCCCKETCGCKKECSCDKGSYIMRYRSTYTMKVINAGLWTEIETLENPPTWNEFTGTTDRHQCARILLGSVCLIWSGIIYLFWTGKQAHNKNSPRWSNYILDGSGLDDGTLSQWLQALGFPKDMLNNSGPANRMDQVINNDFVQKFYLGFADTSTWNAVHGMDRDGNTFRSPASLNVGGFIHAINKGAFGGSVFKSNGTNTSGIDQNKLGPLFKLYIVSCAYFTGLQKKTPPKADNKTPKTIREILYWLSALPYSQVYTKIMDHCKKRLDDIFKISKQEKLSFTFKPGAPPFTVERVNLYAHFQAVTQYCPLVLIGIQGGIHSTDSTTPAIHSLYANTECNFTYPTVSIQAYNQVVHYIRGLFYQLYFLRKQCAVKVTSGGKWRECRYGNGVLGKGVISWMCLGCNPMEHDRKWRVDKVKGMLDGVKSEAAGPLSRAIKDLLVPLGHVVVQLGNAQEALERGKDKDPIFNSLVVGLVGALGGVVGAVKEVLENKNTSSEALKEPLKEALGKVLDVVLEVVKKLEEGVKGKNGNGAQKALSTAKEALEKAKKDLGNGNGNLETAKKKLGELSKDGNGKLKCMWDKLGDGQKALKDFIDVSHGQHQVDPGKNTVSVFIHKVLEVLNILKQIAEKDVKGNGNSQYYYQARIQVIIPAIENMLDMVSSTRCIPCQSHSTKCGRQGEKRTCDKCHQQYMDGFPSPLQAFLEDRLPGFSCRSTMDELDKQEAERAQTKEKIEPPSSALEYPPAADHSHHTNSPGQCCPLPMGFRGQFYSGSTSDSTGQRLYGILYFFSNENLMQSCVYRLVRVTAALSATTPQVLGDVFGFFRGGVGNKEQGKTPKGKDRTPCSHDGDPKASAKKNEQKYFCGWCASGLRDEVKSIQWIPNGGDKDGGSYRSTVGTALINIKGDKDTGSAPKSTSATTTTSLSTLTDGNHYVSPLTGELYTAVSATFGGTYLSWVLYLSDALEGGLHSLASAFQEIECRGCRECDPNKCKKGEHGQGGGQCGCQSIVSCTGVLPVLYRHGFSYGNPFNLEGYQQKDGKTDGQYDIEDKKNPRLCHEFLESLSAVIDKNKQDQAASNAHPLTELLKQVGQLQYDIRLPWIFVLTLAWLVAVLYLAFGAIWPLDWVHMRSHWLRGGEHQWQCMWYKVMTGRKGVDLVEYFGRR